MNIQPQGRRALRRAVPALTLALALALPATAAEAQSSALLSSTPQQRAAIQTAFLKAKLGLDEQQAAKVAALDLRYAEKAEPILKGSSGPFAKRREMNALQEEKEAALREILTPEQFGKYEASREELRDKLEEELGKSRNGGS